jgi:hypothetical protein
MTQLCGLETLFFGTPVGCTPREGVVVRFPDPLISRGFTHMLLIIQTLLHPHRCVARTNFEPIFEPILCIAVQPARLRQSTGPPVHFLA